MIRICAVIVHKNVKTVYTKTLTNPVFSVLCGLLKKSVHNTTKFCVRIVA